MPFFLLILPVLSTLLGGMMAIRLRRFLPFLVAAGAGLLMGAAFLDLLPEALTIGLSLRGRTIDVLGIALGSFLCFFGLQSLLDMVATRWEGSSRALGKVGGLLLIGHSLRDGMAIGLSFAASHTAGYAVAAGIAAHDLGDGMNTVVLTTGGHKPKFNDYLFLIADALAPLLGGLLTLWWTFTLQSSVVLLAVASGFFIQMATNDFLPQAKRSFGSKRFLVPAVVSGAAVIYVANLLAGRLR